MVYRILRSILLDVLSWTIYLLVPLLVLTACQQSPCDGLVYKEFGLTREEYLPCASEMIAKLEEMTPHMKALADGDSDARARGARIFGQLKRRIQALGGVRNLMGGWKDQSLVNLNLKIVNAYNLYQSFLLATLMGPNPLANSDFERGRRHVEDAKRLFRSIR